MCLGMCLGKKSEKEIILLYIFSPLFIVRYLQTFILVVLLSHHLPSSFSSTPQMFYKLWLWHLRESAASSQTSASVPMLHHPWKRALLQVRTRIEQHAVLYVKKQDTRRAEATQTRTRVTQKYTLYQKLVPTCPHSSDSQAGRQGTRARPLMSFVSLANGAFLSFA